MALLMAACAPGTPSQYIQPDDMEDILVDYYMARALAQQQTADREFQSALFIESALKKHGVTQAQFDSSLVYYYTRADRFDAIFQRVSDRLDEQALILGASEGEIGKYAQVNNQGDTANVWADRRDAVLLPYPPYNRWEFSIEADSTYRRGDQLMLMFMSDYMYQSGKKGGMAYLAVDYGDTIVGRSQRFTTTGLNQLRLVEDTARTIRSIKGFFYLDGAQEVNTATRLLFLNSVQLIRFHTKPVADEQTDSIPRDSVGGQLPADTLGGRDSIGSGGALLPPGRGDGLHGVEAGADSAATRRERLPARVL